MLISTGDVFFGKRVLVCDRRWSCFMCSWGGRVEYAACSSMYAAIRAVSGRASPRRKPTPSSVSRSPDEYDALDSRRQPHGLRPELGRVSRAPCHGSIIPHQVRGNTEQKSVHRGCGRFLGGWTKGLSYVRSRGTRACGGLVLHSRRLIALYSTVAG